MACPASTASVTSYLAAPVGSKVTWMHGGATAHRRARTPSRHRKRGHAYRNALHFRVSDDDMDMAVGPARNGALLEVGFIRAVDGEVVILHAMPVREKFL